MEFNLERGKEIEGERKKEKCLLATEHMFPWSWTREEE